MTGTLTRVTDGAVVAGRLEVADSFFKRARGLLGRSGLPEDGGLMIEPCSSVHMFFMRFAIDVVYAVYDGTDELVVRKVVSDLRPWRLSACRGARVAIELPAGTVEARGLRPEDRLRFDPGSALGG